MEADSVAGIGTGSDNGGGTEPRRCGLMVAQPNVASPQTGSATSSGVPHSPDDRRAAFGIARIVDMVTRATEQDAAYLGTYGCPTIESARMRCARDSLERGLNLLNEEERRIAAIDRPPCPDCFEVPLGRIGDDDPEGCHEPRRRRSASTSAADRSRPPRAHRPPSLPGRRADARARHRQGHPRSRLRSARLRHLPGDPSAHRRPSDRPAPEPSSESWQQRYRGRWFPRKAPSSYSGGRSTIVYCSSVLIRYGQHYCVAVIRCTGGVVIQIAVPDARYVIDPKRGTSPAPVAVSAKAAARVRLPEPDSARRASPPTASR